MKKGLYNTLAFVGLGIGSLALSSLGLLCLGGFIGTIINPHKHYDCLCDEPPILTHAQGLVFGISYLILLMIALYFLIRQIKQSVIWQWITWIGLVLINGYICFEMIDILTTKVSG